MPGSGFLVGPNHHIYIVADIVALMPAIMVLTAITPMRPSIADSELPGLNPNQPNARDERPEHDHRQVVRRDRVDQLAILVVFAQTRPNQLPP